MIGRDVSSWTLFYVIVSIILLLLGVVTLVPGRQEMTTLAVYWLGLAILNEVTS